LSLLWGFFFALPAGGAFAHRQTQATGYSTTIPPVTEIWGAWMGVRRIFGNNAWLGGYAMNGLGVAIQFKLPCIYYFTSLFCLFFFLNGQTNRKQLGHGGFLHTERIFTVHGHPGNAPFFFFLLSHRPVFLSTPYAITKDEKAPVPSHTLSLASQRPRTESTFSYIPVI
jgi:hypothetical protein